MNQHFWSSLGILVTFGLAFDGASFVALVASEPVHQTSAGGLQGVLLDRCCQVGREKAIESSKFNCKLSAREILVSGSNNSPDNRNKNGANLLALSADSLLSRDQNFADQCEMVLESCCLAFHRTRNCDSGKQFAKSGTSCMDVELSKEATIATESFNDCCMSCSLGILAARNPPQNDSTTRTTTTSERCKLISPLASSLSGQLYEQTYTECCLENLPRPSGALIEPGAPIDCTQANACSQRCSASGSLDPITRLPLDQDRCDCFTGYKLASDQVTCIDIDECKLNLHTCNKQSEICDNTRGSFRCLARSANQLKSNLEQMKFQQYQQHHYSNFHQSNSHHHSRHSQHHQQKQQPTSRLISDSSTSSDQNADDEPVERPFNSFRLHPIGSSHW